jgi:hypothetical protein
MSKSKSDCIIEEYNPTTFNIINKKPQYNKSPQLENIIDVRHKKCTYPGCPKNPSFNYSGEKLALFCGDHKDKQMINIKIKDRCQYENCTTIACYNLPGNKKGIFCNQHKTYNMIDIKNKSLCLVCDQRASFNYPSELKGIYCSRHKEKTMINVDIKYCAYPHCNVCPTFNFKGYKAKFCQIHAEKNMVNVKDKNCIYEGCDKKAYYNLPNCKSKLYCQDHKSNEMVFITTTCAFEGCSIRPNFNMPDQKSGLYCVTHKTKEMIDVNHKMCQHEGCTTRASFNYKGEKTGLYCFKHKLINMINIKSKICEENGCTKQPSFNFPHLKAAYCSKHRKDGMKDVKHKSCQYENCTTCATYGYPSGKCRPVYCALHKLIGMINLRGKKCQHEKCKNKPTHGYPDKKSLYCLDHQLPNMVNTLEYNQCQFDNCTQPYEFVEDNKRLCAQHSSQNYDIILKRKCKYCDLEEKSIYVCKECQNTQNKTEWMVIRYLRKNITTPFLYNSNKMLQCSLRRPDVYFELEQHCVIVEVDENQHQRYPQACECARINDIVNGIGGKSVIFIRFNPDQIKNQNQNIEIDLTTKLDKLVNVIKDELMKQYNHFIIKLIQLYYNDDYELYQKYKEENITTLVCI